MTLSRWRRVATGIAAGVIVLCAALLGATFRSDSGDVSVASDLRPTNVIPIEEDPDDIEAAEADAATDAGDDSVQVIETDALPDESDDTDDPDDTDATGADDGADAAGDAEADAGLDESNEASDAPSDTGDTGHASDTSDAEEAPADDTDDADAADDAGAADDAASTDDGGDSAAADDTAEAEPATPPAPITAADDALGTGGGVDDAECALDRLVIYAGARRGGVAGSIRAALAQAGFAANCPTPVTVLASNCPQQFAGVLGAGSGYDPLKSYVAASDAVDRETMTAVMGTIGYSGNAIDILDFGFVNPDQPGEQWMAIFVPPSFSGWEDLAARAGLSPTATSLCAPSGELG